MNIKKLFFYLIIILNSPLGVGGFGEVRGQSYSVWMAESFMSRHKDSIAVKEGKPAAWDYEQGLMLKALEKVCPHFFESF